MAAFISRLVRDRSTSEHQQRWQDRGADFGRDHRRGDGDRYQFDHSFRQHRQRPDATKHSPLRFFFRRPGSATLPLQSRPAAGFAIAPDLVAFVLLATLAVAGLVAAVITPPI